MSSFNVCFNVCLCVCVLCVCLLVCICMCVRVCVCNFSVYSCVCDVRIRDCGHQIWGLSYHSSECVNLIKSLFGSRLRSGFVLVVGLVWWRATATLRSRLRANARHTLLFEHRPIKRIVVLMIQCAEQNSVARKMRKIIIIIYYLFSDNASRVVCVFCGA